MTWLWISLYVLAAIAYVPISARAWYDPKSSGIIDGDRSACIGVSIVTAYAWPVFAVLGLLYIVSKRLVPVIFR